MCDLNTLLFFSAEWSKENKSRNWYIYVWNRTGLQIPWSVATFPPAENIKNTLRNKGPVPESMNIYRDKDWKQPLRLLIANC